MGCCDRKNEVIATHRARKNPPSKAPMAIDGGFVFLGDVPEVEGFRREGSTLMSEFPSCPKRTYMPYLGADGQYSVKTYCRHRGCSLRGSQVTLEDCVNCPVRSPS